MSLFILIPAREASEQSKGAQRSDQKRGAGHGNGFGNGGFHQELKDDEAEQGDASDGQQQPVHRPGFQGRASKGRATGLIEQEPREEGRRGEAPGPQQRQCRKCQRRVQPRVKHRQWRAPEYLGVGHGLKPSAQ